MNLEEIKESIRTNGELNSETNGLINGGASISRGQTIDEKYGLYYDGWKENIDFYGALGETDDQIRTRFPVNCN